MSEQQAKPAQKKGRIHIYAGDGKGKTTAATGLSVRAAGRQWRVLFVQFLKSGKSAELNILRSLPTVEVVSGQTISKFSFQMTPEEKITALAEMGGRLAEALEKAQQGEVDLLVLDEALGAIQAGMIPQQEILDFLKNKPEALEVVLTGRNPSQELIDLADYYSEVVMRKHPYETEGLDARPGVEF